MKTLAIYKLMACFYDLLDVIYFRDKGKNPRKVVLDAIEHRDRILDLCTGTATNAINISVQRPRTQIAGIDLSKDMLRVAGQKVKKKGISNIKLYAMDATALKFRDRFFDKILISLILHELEEELADKMLHEAVRVLKDEGRIVVTEWEPSKIWWQKLMFFPIQLLEPKPYHSFIKKDLKNYFARLGLEIEAEVHCDYSKVLILRKMTV